MQVGRTHRIRPVQLLCALADGRTATGDHGRHPVQFVPVENAVIRNCARKEGHGGITIGSEISGGARNVFAEKCRLDSPELERALRFKTNTLRGGVVRNKPLVLKPVKVKKTKTVLKRQQRAAKRGATKRR